MMKKLALALALLAASPAQSQVFTTVPFIFAGGTPANASQVMANFQSIVNNGNAVANYINSQISAVTPPVSGTFVFFHLSSCPTGWTLYPLSGYFPRGADLGRGLDITGTPVGSGEVQQLQDHTHSTSVAINSVGTVGIVIGGSTNSELYAQSYATTTNGVTSATTTGNPSNTVLPKTTYLLLCSKN